MALVAVGGVEHVAVVEAPVLQLHLVEGEGHVVLGHVPRELHAVPKTRLFHRDDLGFELQELQRARPKEGLQAEAGELGFQGLPGASRGRNGSEGGGGEKPSKRRWETEPRRVGQSEPGIRARTSPRLPRSHGTECPACPWSHCPQPWPTGGGLKNFQVRSFPSWAQLTRQDSPVPESAPKEGPPWGGGERLTIISLQLWHSW